MSEPTVREAIGAALDKADAAAGNAGTPPPSAPSAPAGQPAGAPEAGAAPAPSQSNGSGGAAPYLQPGGAASPPKPAQVPAPQLPPKPGAQVAPSAGQQAPAPGAAAAAPAGASLRAPQTWRPEARELWGKLDPAVQAEVIRREKETARAVQAALDDRKHIEQFDKIVAPYQHLIAMSGGDPMAAFGDYLKTTAVLRTGTPMEKAQALAFAAQQFAVDLGMLDRALVATMGQQAGVPNPQAPVQQPSQYQDPRVDQILAAMQQQRQAREQQVMETASQSIEEFRADPANEFVNDVRHEMADLLEMAANRGRKLSLKEAYDLACSTHPEIGKVVAQRAAAAAASQPNLRAKQLAASSTPGGLGGANPGGSEKPMSVREAIEHSIATLQQ